MRGIRFIGPILAALVLSGCLNQEADHIAVVGVGEARMLPDQASLSISAEGKGKTAGEATEVLNAKISQIRTIAAEFGSDDRFVSSVYFDVTPRTKRIQNPDRTWTTVPDGYLASQTLQIRTTVIENAGELFGALIRTDVARVSNPIYLIEDSSALFEKARDLAIKDARQRATLYAAGAGKTLGAIAVIEEAGTDAQRLAFNLRDRFVVRYAQKEQGGELTEQSAPGDAVTVTASRSSIYTKPEEIAVTVSIYAKFGLD